MARLNDSEWLLINEIIYKINTVDSINEVKITFLNLIKHLLSYDSALFYLTDSDEEKLLSSPVCINYNTELANRYIEIGKEKDYALGIMQCSKSMVFIETDLMSDHERENSEYYKMFLSSQGLHYAIQMTFVYNDVFLGLVSLIRKNTRLDFSDKDAFILDILKDHVAFRLHNDLNQNVTSINIENAYFKQAEEQYELTRRELEIFILMVNNLSNDEISNKLMISANTVKKHIMNIYRKLNVNNRLKFQTLINQLLINQQ